MRILEPPNTLIFTVGMNLQPLLALWIHYRFPADLSKTQRHLINSLDRFAILTAAVVRAKLLDPDDRATKFDTMYPGTCSPGLVKDIHRKELHSAIKIFIFLVISFVP